MRSDYYDGVSQTPLRPLPPHRKRRSMRKKILLFLLVLALLIGGSVGVAFGMRAARPAPPSSPPVPEIQQTTIPRLPPPGEGTLSAANGPAPTLDPTEIYELVNPSIVTVTAIDDFGRGGEGTGVAFDADGYIVTNAHIIENTSRVQVTLADGRIYPAHLIGMDEQIDLAVLRVAAELTPAVFGNDAELKVGEPAYALGNPLGSRFRGTMTDGIISAINRNVYMEDQDVEMTLIQTTAAINTGSSGGALVDSRGYVFGITYMKMMSTGNTVEGLGFAIPSSTVVDVVNKLMSSGYVSRPMLGITVQPNRTEVGHPSGLLVVKVEEASDAWIKGIRAGDVLLTANGAYLAENDDLLYAKEGLEAGEGILLRWRSAETGKELEAEILLVEQAELEK